MRDGSDYPAQPGADAAGGRAALLLVESLLHGLIARKLLTTVDAVEIVEIAADAGSDQEAPHRAKSATELLEDIQKSLESDIDFKQ